MSTIQNLVNNLKFEQDARGTVVLTTVLERSPKVIAGLEFPRKPLRVQFTDKQVLAGQFPQITFPNQDAYDYFARAAGEMVLRRQGVHCA